MYGAGWVALMHFKCDISESIKSNIPNSLKCAKNIVSDCWCYALAAHRFKIKYVQREINNGHNDNDRVRFLKFQMFRTSADLMTTTPPFTVLFFRSFATRKCLLRIFKCLNIFEWSFLCSDFFGQFAISFLRLLLLPWCIMHTQLFDNSFWTNQQYTVSHEFTFMSIRMNCAAFVLQPKILHSCLIRLLNYTN